VLKQGREAFYTKRFDEAEKHFREAKDLALAGKHWRLYARALGRLQNVLGFRGRIGEVWEEVRGATLAAMDRGEDGPAVLIMQSLFFLAIPPTHNDLPNMLRDWVARANRYPPELDLARAAGQVAIVLTHLGDFNGAANMIKQALPELEKELGLVHPEVAMMVHNLADTMGAAAQYRNDQQTEPMLRRVLAIHDKALAPGHPERMMPLFNLALLLTRTKRYEHAERMFLGAQRVALDFEGPNGGGVTMIRQGMNRLEEATFDASVEGYLKGRLDAEGIVEGELAVRLVHLCRHYFARGKLAEAEPHYRRMMELSARLDDIGRAIVAAERGVPSKIYGLMADDRRDLAEKLLLGELEVMHKVLGEEHAEALAQRYFLGNFYRMIGRPQESLQVFQELADLRRKLTPSDTDRADGLLRLMDAQLYVGDRQAADRTAAEIEQLTGKKPVMDPALNEFSRQLRSVWQALQLEKEPDLVGAALSGDPGAGLVVGLCWAAGQGVRPDFEKARPWLDAAAKAGNPLGVRIAEVLKSGQQIQFDLQFIGNAAQAWVNSGQRP